MTTHQKVVRGDSSSGKIICAEVVRKARCAPVADPRETRFDGVAMRSVRSSRSQLTGLLIRPPCIGGERRDWATLVVDPVKQLEELDDLRNRGLLSNEEFEWQRARLLQR